MSVEIDSKAGNRALAASNGIGMGVGGTPGGKKSHQRLFKAFCEKAERLSAEVWCEIRPVAVVAPVMVLIVLALPAWMAGGALMGAVDALRWAFRQVRWALRDELMEHMRVRDARRKQEGVRQTCRGNRS